VKTHELKPIEHCPKEIQYRVFTFHNHLTSNSNNLAQNAKRKGKEKEKMMGRLAKC
jgi:hypothetical protein